MTPNLWTLPETVHFADTDWRVHTGDWRSCAGWTVLPTLH